MILKYTSIVVLFRIYPYSFGGLDFFNIVVNCNMTLGVLRCMLYFQFQHWQRLLKHCCNAEFDPSFGRPAKKFWLKNVKFTTCVTITWPPFWVVLFTWFCIGPTIILKFGLQIILFLADLIFNKLARKLTL